MKNILRIKSTIKFMISFGVCMYIMVLSGTAIAQNTSTITGTVTDQATSEPLPGVNISVQGTTSGTITNADGQFELDVPSLSDTLQFSYIGYSTLTVPIDGRTEINVSIKPSTISGEELVVVGYGT